MFRLTEQQVAFVTADVENEGINYSHLSTDLIDHICCDIESRMDQNIPFDKAYSSVKEEYNIKGLRQIQQDTLMLIDKNYRIMKKSMKLIGVLAMSLMAFGALFKLFHWPGAVLMLIVSFFFTAMVFFPTLLYVIYKEVNQKKQAITYLTAFVCGVCFMIGVLIKILHWPEGNLLFFLGIALINFLLIPMIMIRTKQLSINKPLLFTGLISLMVFLTGLIFKIQHWPGASNLLGLGSIALVFVFIPMYYQKEIKKAEKIRPDFIFGIVALTYFIIFSFLLNLRGRESHLSFYHSNISYTENSNYLNSCNNNKKSSLNNQQISEFVKQADLLYNQIEDLKIKIVLHHNNGDRESAIKILNTNKPLLNKETTTSFLVSELNSDKPLISLKNEIELFQESYKTIVNDSVLKLPINKIFETNRIAEYETGFDLTWENYHFRDCKFNSVHK